MSNPSGHLGTQVVIPDFAAARSDSRAAWESPTNERAKSRIAAAGIGDLVNIPRTRGGPRYSSLVPARILYKIFTYVGRDRYRERQKERRTERERKKSGRKRETSPI